MVGSILWTTGWIVWNFFVCLLVLLVVLVVVEETRRPRNLPPTPGNRRPLPFVGSVLDLPKDRAWIKFREWFEQYGPILTIWNGSVPTILIGDPEIAAELLDKRSQKYSSRPRLVVSGELLTENKIALFSPYGERWRAYRRVLHYGTTNKAVDTYLPIFVMEGKVLTTSLLRNPDDWYNQMFRYTASSVIAVAFGRRILDITKDTAYLKLGASIEFMLKMNVPGAQWHEMFPFLKYLPSALNGIKRKALAFREVLNKDQASLIDEVQRKIRKGTAPASYARSILENREKFSDLDEIEFNSAPGTIFNAGVDTTSATLQNFVLAIVLHPEAQERAQAEIDKVVGPERSPVWEDEVRLPYVQALIKEVMRWRPVSVLGAIPHASTEDDYFVHDGKEYFIPKGASIVGCLWAISNCKRIYDRPDLFTPERFLGSHQFPGTGSKGHSSFGWGRRICPGQYLAERSLFHTIVRLLWAFKFSQAKSPTTGELITPDCSIETGYTAGFNVRPVPFPCAIEVRTPAIKEIVLKEEKEALDGLQEFEDYDE